MSTQAGALPKNASTLRTAFSWNSGRSSYVTTRPSGPAPRANAMVSAPDPVEALDGLRDIGEVAQEHVDPGRGLAEERLHVADGLLVELRAQLVRDHPALRPGASGQRDGERT